MRLLIISKFDPSKRYAGIYLLCDKSLNRTSFGGILFYICVIFHNKKIFKKKRI